jgi:tripartite-type tricarboxylate transporter receptor subunit TctC
MLYQAHRLLIAALFLSLCATCVANAQSYPSKPITIRIGFQAGAGTDTAIRAALPILQRNLGQTVVVENMPGANGSIAAMSVLNSAPDGYTLLGLTGGDLLAGPLTISSAKYTIDSFKLVGVFAVGDLVLIAPPTTPFKNLDGVVQYLKNADNKQLSIANWGPGSTGQLAGADLQNRAKAKLLEVPYKGTSPIATAVGGGEVDLAFVPLAAPILGMIQTGRVKALALSGSRRHAAFPDLALVRESAGFENSQFGVWPALFVSARTPEHVVERLSAAMSEWIESSENQALLKAAGLRKVAPMTPQQASAYLRSENETYLRIAKTLRLLPE